MKKVYFSGYYGKKSFGDDLFVYSLFDYFKNKYDIKFLSIPISDIHENYFLYKKKSKIKNLFSFIRFITFAKFDFIVFAGGSTYKTKKLFSKRFVVDLFKKKNKIIFGAGIGPFNSQNDKNYFTKLFSQYALIIVRDKVSYKSILNNTFELGADIAHNYILI